MADTAFPTDADFEVFYERHWKYVYRLCYSYMKNQSDAEDCAEDAFVRALSRDLPFEDEVHERKWLTVTAINLCKDKLKSAAYKTTISMEDDSVKEPAAEEAEDFSDVHSVPHISFLPSYRVHIFRIRHDRLKSRITKFPK